MTDEEIYQKYMRILAVKINASYEAKGLKASGEFGRSLEGFIDGKIFGLKGASYALQMEEGRSAGAYSNIEKLKEWIAVKEGLPQVFKDNPDRFAFLIARKHFLEGLRVPNEFNEGGVLSEPIDLFLKEDFPSMFRELADKNIRELTARFTTILAA